MQSDTGRYAGAVHRQNLELVAQFRHQSGVVVLRHLTGKALWTEGRLAFP